MKATGAGPAPRQRHVPLRTCIACRAGKAKRELVRVVRLASGAVVVDPGGKMSGRGAYLCRSSTCWSLGLGRGALTRALKIDAISASDEQRLTEFAAALNPLEVPLVR